MFSLDYIVLHHNILNRFSFLSDFGIQSGQTFYNIGANRDILIWLSITIVIVLFIKNSNQLLNNFKYRFYNALFIVFSILTFYFMKISYSKSIFLYFNF